MEPLDFCQCRTKGPIMQAPAGSVFHPGTVCGKCMHPREPAKLPEDPETMTPVAVAMVSAEPAGAFVISKETITEALSAALDELPANVGLGVAPEDVFEAQVLFRAMRNLFEECSTRPPIATYVCRMLAATIDKKNGMSSEGAADLDKMTRDFVYKENV